MNNKEKYHFSDFTRSNYRRLVILAKEKYKFRSYYNFIDGEKFIIWRHDVDFSPHSARKLAQIEYEEEIKSTYFILFHSEFYNLLEKEVTNCFNDIIALGHDIGLHFDPSYYDLKKQDQIDGYLTFEKNYLEKLFNVEIKSFSFHITNPLAIECTKFDYGGLINATSDFFRHKVEYCSDSNGYWRFRRLEDILQKKNDNKSLQVLTHPEMWQDSIMSPKERVMRCIDGRSKKTKQWYENILKAYGRPNIDWE